MKNIILAFACTVLYSISFAQSDNDYLEYSRSVLNSEKKAVVAEAMQLNDEQSKIFWPLYNEFNGKLYEVESKTYQVIMDYSKEYENMTDEKADELWNRAMKAQMERQKLIATYYAKFKKVLPAGLVVKYFQVENKIDVMIDAAIAMEVPLVETKK